MNEAGIKDIFRHDHSVSVGYGEWDSEDLSLVAPVRRTGLGAATLRGFREVDCSSLAFAPA
jgi:hypothetical protein